MGSLTAKMMIQWFLYFLLQILTILADNQTISADPASILEECISDTDLLLENLLDNSCCIRNETDWLTQDKEDKFICTENPCHEDIPIDKNGFSYNGTATKSSHQHSVPWRIRY